MQTNTHANTQTHIHEASNKQASNQTQTTNQPKSKQAHTYIPTYIQTSRPARKQTEASAKKQAYIADRQARQGKA